MLNRNGSILFTALIILIFLSTLGMSSVVFLLARTTKSTLELDRLQALYLAEAGIAKSLFELKRDQDLDNNGVGNILRTKLGEGTYKASHNFQVSIITGTGEYNGVKRRVQIKYSAL